MATQKAGDSANPRTEERELTITRIFDAPREAVFKGWIEPARAKRWWGPEGFETPTLEMDLRPGGEWHGNMRSPEGKDYPQSGVFHEIVRPERLVFTFKWVNESDPESLVTVAFAERGGKTEMTFNQIDFKSVESRESHEEGWNESFDRLAEDLRKG